MFAVLNYSLDERKREFTIVCVYLCMNSSCLRNKPEVKTHKTGSTLGAKERKEKQKIHSLQIN